LTRKPLFLRNRQKEKTNQKGKTKMAIELLDITELSKMLRLSVSMLRKRIAKARNGESDFPLPISSPKEKNRWQKKDIENWINRKAQPATPTNPTANSKRKQDEIDRALASHGIKTTKH
jgi:predicted DNA-binding transcriptional regulator AlpA